MKCTAAEFLDAVRRSDTELLSGLSIREHVNTARYLSGRLALHEAVAAGENMDLIRLLVDQGADINMPDSSGKTPVRIAVENKRNPTAQQNRTFHHMVRYFIENESADFSKKCDAQTSAIEYMIHNSDTMLLMVTLTQRNTTYPDPHGELLAALTKRNFVTLIDAAQVFLVPCNFNAVCSKKFSILYFAATCLSWRVVEYMVENTDADVTFTYDVPPESHVHVIPPQGGMPRYSVLDLSVGHVKPACIYSMLNRGAQINNVAPIVATINQRDPDNILISLIRTMAPNNLTCHQILNQTRGYDNVTTNLRTQALNRIVMSYLYEHDTIYLYHSEYDEVIHDQLLRGKRLLQTVQPEHIESGRFNNSPVIRAAFQPWNKTLHHFVYSRNFRTLVSHIFLVQHMSRIHMPHEMWVLLVSLLGRDNIELDLRPTQHAGHPRMVAWRASFPVSIKQSSPLH